MSAAPDRHDLAVVIGAAVRDARTRLGLDQATVAELAGVSVRFLREVEHGKDTVRLRHLLAVLDVLGIDLAVTPRSGHQPPDDPPAR